MNATNPFVGMFPGFDFLRQAASGPISNLPGLGTWLPTLDPRELDSRVNELQTVLFWLEQNTAIVINSSLRRSHISLIVIKSHKYRQFLVDIPFKFSSVFSIHQKYSAVIFQLLKR